MSSELVNRLLEPLRRRLDNMVARALVSLVKEGSPLQLVQIVLAGQETLDGVERVQNFGFSSSPFPPSGTDGAQAVVLFLRGSRGNPVVVAMDDPRYRPDLLPGESQQFSKFGQRVYLKADGSVEVYAPAGVQLKGAPILAAKGVVQGDCICAFTGAPHPQTSLTVEATP